MRGDQVEMVAFLEELIDQVRRDELIGLAVGIVSRPKLVQAAFFGRCSEQPLETIGVVHMMLRSLDEHLFAGTSPPAAAPSGTGKK